MGAVRAKYGSAAYAGNLLQHQPLCVGKAASHLNLLKTASLFEGLFIGIWMDN